MINRKNEELFLIVDQGDHASRVVIMDGMGVPVAWAERPLNTYRPQDGYVEHDPLELLWTVQESLEEVVLKVGSRVNSIRAAGFATQRLSIVCWDSQTGEALSQVISWQDTRARIRMDAMSNRAEDLHQSTGLFLSAHYGASKLSWCLENSSVIKEAWETGRLCQRLADLSSIRVHRPAESEATSRGTSFLLSGMPEAWPDPEPGTWFRPGDGTAISERFDRWLEEMEKNVRGEG